MPLDVEGCLDRQSNVERSEAKRSAANSRLLARGRDGAKKGVDGENKRLSGVKHGGVEPAVQQSARVFWNRGNEDEVLTWRPRGLAFSSLRHHHIVIGHGMRGEVVKFTR